MDNLTEKLEKEFCEWVNNLHNDYQQSSQTIFLDKYAYEYTIKKEIIHYFEDNIILYKFEKYLMSKLNTLEYLYYEYMDDDTANVHNEIDYFIDNLIYRLKSK